MKIAMYDTKPYDKEWFEKKKPEGYEIIYFETKLRYETAALAYDPYPDASLPVTYVEKEELFRNSNIISLHCPLTTQTHHIINEESIQMMKDGVMLINTSRGALVKKEALLGGLKEKKIGAAGLDVYEEEADYFYEDCSNEIIEDDVLSLLVSMPNVLLTSHQAFLTIEAL